MFEPFEITDPITTDAGTFRIQLYPDHDPMSPREWSNVGRLTISARNIIDPDPDSDVARVLDEVQGGRISTRAACRYLRHALGARVVLPVQVDGYSHEYSAGEPVDDGMGVDGFTYDTAEGRALLGNDPADEDITRALVGELEVYSSWASGGFVGYVIQRLDDPDGDADPDDDASWSDVEHVGGSVWGFESDDPARESAEEEIRGYGPGDFPSPVLAVQV